jgi:hypothetical protein
METIFGVVLTDPMAFGVTGRDRGEEWGLLIPRLIEVPELRGYRAHGRDSKIEREQVSAPSGEQARAERRAEFESNPKLPYRKSRQPQPNVKIAFSRWVFSIFSRNHHMAAHRVSVKIDHHNVGLQNRVVIGWMER